jgi:hypothetical protein
LRDALERDWVGVSLRELWNFDLPATRAWASRDHRPIPCVLGALLARNGSVFPRASIAPRESGAIIRVRRCPWIAALLDAAPLAARVAARVADLAELLTALESGDQLPDACRLAATSIAPNRGRAETLVARGLLRHEAELDGDRISGYAVSAPTDSNFSGDGAYSWHVQRECPEDAATALEIGQLWALALDPCVQYRVTVGGAANA